MTMNDYNKLCDDLYNEYFGDLDRSFKKFEEAEKARKQKKNTYKGITKEELDKVLNETYKRYCVF